MRKAAFGSATALMMIVSSYAVAQEPTAAQAQQQSFPAQPQKPGTTTAPDHTVPPPPEAQPQAPLADQAKPAAVGPSQSNTASNISNGDKPPGATPQTTPSTISADHAKLDKLPTTALQFPLSDEQKKLIAKSIVSQPATQGGGELANVHVADFLPINTESRGFSPEVTSAIPGAKDYKYIKLDKRVLVVDSTNQTVVGEIAL